MKIIVLFALFALAVADFEYYKTKNDHIDIEAMIASVSELQASVDCLNDKKTCTEVTASYKKNFPEAVKQAYRKCNLLQKHSFRRFLDGLKEVLPKEYDNLKEKYDNK